MRIDFRPLATRDFPLLYIWLNTDFVMEWFEKKLMTCDEVENKYNLYITKEKPTRAYIITIDDTDIGYIQTYLIGDYPEYNRYVLADEHAAGVDLFIGHRDYVHKGFGARIMTVFLKNHVFSNPRVDRCVIGPEPKNLAAIQMYEKAGFRWYKTIQLPDEDEPEYMMRLMKKEFTAIDK